jgi:hypothetical protein
VSDPTYYLAIDPGQNTGWATFNHEGVALGFGILRKSTPELATTFLSTHRPQLIVVENFRVRDYKAKAFTWSDMLTSRIIGAVEGYGALTGTTVVKQEPPAKDIGYMWAGMPKPKGHDPDDQAAYAHGVHYIIKNKIRHPTAFMAKGGTHGAS